MCDSCIHVHVHVISQPLTSLTFGDCPNTLPCEQVRRFEAPAAPVLVRVTGGSHDPRHGRGRDSYLHRIWRIGFIKGSRQALTKATTISRTLVDQSILTTVWGPATLVGSCFGDCEQTIFKGRVLRSAECTCCYAPPLPPTRDFLPSEGEPPGTPRQLRGDLVASAGRRSG